MPLQVNTAPDSLTAFTFSFVVPGSERWKMRSIIATASRDVGGAPDRAFLLSVTNESNIVAQTGATDAGDEPGIGSVTWTDAPAGAVTAGALGYVVAPLPRLLLEGGYVITGRILNPAPADTWLTAVAWYDFTYTVNR